MALLGLLCRFGPCYGYELRVLIERQNLHRVADVRYGSIYAALKRLARDKLVVEVERSRAGNRPERVAFEVTDEGRAALRTLLSDAIRDPGQAERPVDIALHFSGLLDLDEVESLIRTRMANLGAYHAAITRAPDPSPHPDPGMQALLEDIREHFVAVNRAERAWTETVLARVKAGGYAI
jgi:DNA-binding PadR family transcriptional regulator